MQVWRELRECDLQVQPSFACSNEGIRSRLEQGGLREGTGVCRQGKNQKADVMARSATYKLTSLICVQDCPKSHVSPAQKTDPQGLNVAQYLSKEQPAAAATPVPAPVAPQQAICAPNPGAKPCMYGMACTRPGCFFSHPAPAAAGPGSIPCKFGNACTRRTFLLPVTRVPLLCDADFAILSCSGLPLLASSGTPQALGLPKLRILQYRPQVRNLLKSHTRLASHSHQRDQARLERDHERRRRRAEEGRRQQDVCADEEVRRE